ncbi:HlyD family type I secretion periplasmic adaptor subunit [Orientia tsutsugamushi]|uniref:HlyD family type I secretion periplasmic adaptor subunit n=1 Tax=Orientia tsutsugamushi TaxID=784 RepID=UPI003528C75E
MSQLRNDNNNDGIKGIIPKMSPQDRKNIMDVLLQNQQKQQKLEKSKWLKSLLKAILLQLTRLIYGIGNAVDSFISFIINSKGTAKNIVVQTARGPILFGVWGMIIFIVVGGLWSALAPLDSAAVAVGTVISSTENKIIQHQEGGIVKEIFVKQGDYVKTGDPIIALDDTKIRASVEIKLGQYRTLLANQARLTAELEQQEEIIFSEFLVNNNHIPEVAKIMSIQQHLFQARKKGLNARIMQFEKRIDSLEAKVVASKKQLEYVRKLIKNAESLIAQGFGQKTELDKLLVEESSLVGNIIITELEINSTQQDIERTKSEAIDRTLSELKEVEHAVIEAQESYNSLIDILSRTLVKSPVDGIIKVLDVNTQGGVIGSGQRIAEITPSNDSLIIKAKIPQKNIDSVKVGLKAKIRFGAFKYRTTPVFTGRVVLVSPDTVQDQQSAMQFNNAMIGDTFYIAKIEIDMDEFNKVAKVKNLKLFPGMQADIQIITGTRTLLRYLLDPITDNMFRAFTEK